MAQRIHLVAAARPNFMKVAPLWHALTASPDFEPVLIHTGQHYDANMSADILADLGLFDRDNGIKTFTGENAETKNALVNWGLGALAWLIVGRVVERVVRP